MTSTTSITSPHKHSISDKDTSPDTKVGNGQNISGIDTEEQTTTFASTGNHSHVNKRSPQTCSESKKSTEIDSRHQRQLTVMLLVVTTTFLLLTSPQYVRYIIFSFLDITQDEQTFAFATLFYHLTNKLFYTNSAVNFFLYCIAGSKFRSDVRLLWRRHFNRRREHPSHTHKSSSSE